MMPILPSARLWLRAFLRRGAAESDLDREMRVHLEMEIEQNVRNGMTPAEAQRQALIAFGGVERHKESVRDERGVRWLDDAAQDLRYALRSLLRTPAFTAVAILTLALGVGANVAMFTVVNGVLLRPLPLRDPARLVLLHYGPPDYFFGTPSLAGRQFMAVRDHAQSFEGIATFSPNARQLTITGGGGSEVVNAEAVTSEFFSVLGVNPAMGRGFSPNDGRKGEPPVLMLGDALWRERFASDPNIVGKTITVEQATFFSPGATSYRVVGVMPAGFDFPTGRQLWLASDDGPAPTGFTIVEPVVARLKPGVTVEQAQAELASIARSVPVDPHMVPHAAVARVLPLAQLLVRNAERSLLVFAGAVAFVLLIACVNVANLMLARAGARTQEMSVRVTLGAGRGRLVRQLLAESTLLSLIGAGAGIPLAVVGVRVLLVLAPKGSIPRVNEIRVDGIVLAFTIVVALVTGIAFGLAPALQASRRAPGEALGHGARVTRGRHRMRNALAVSEIALALVLLTGAGLMVKSFLRLRALDLGFHPDHVVTMSVDLPSSKYATAEQMEDFHARMLFALERIPERTAAGAVSFRPFAGGMNLALEVEGKPPLPGGAWTPTASAGYFRAIGIPLLSGRTFTQHEEETATSVAIVSRSVADRAWPGENAIGKRVAFRWRADSTSAPGWLTVVGVVGDIRQELTEPPGAAVYQPISQGAALSNPSLARLGVHDLGALRRMSFVVRSSDDPPAMERAMRSAIQGVDPDVALQSLSPLSEVVAASRSEPLFQARLLTAFSFVALLLAAVGIYGVLACSVTERTREIGIRMALGAESSQVVQIVVRRAALLAALGITIGAAGAVATTRVLSQFLYAVSATDPATFAVTALVLAAVALTAGMLPARRASKVDPLIALRHE
ncbi:MAG: ADOP family duplicated permease [Gemmatimonadaceae bacterium]